MERVPTLTGGPEGGQRSEPELGTTGSEINVELHSYSKGSARTF